MDEGASTLLPGYPIGVLAIAEAIDRRERGTYPSTSPQTTVCMALVVGGRTPTYPLRLRPWTLDIGCAGQGRITTGSSG